MWHFKSFHRFIHELKHKEVAVHASSEDVFIVKARLNVPDAAMMIVMNVKRPVRAEVFKVISSVQRVDTDYSIVHSKEKEFT